MKPSKSKSVIPVGRRALEVNAIDHHIRCCGGTTVAIDMEPPIMQISKRRSNATQHIEFLTRRIGELRLEVDFYRKCYKYNQAKDENTEDLYQTLLQHYITFLCADPSFPEDIRHHLNEISITVNSILDQKKICQKKQDVALEEFAKPYKDQLPLQSMREEIEGMF